MKRMVARDGVGPRKHVALLLAAVVVLGLTPAFASATARGPQDRVTPTVKIARTYVGPLLVNKSGYTVYMFVRDKRGKDVCLTIKRCEHYWPAVTTTGKPVAGPGVKKSLLGTIPYRTKHQGKLREVTYNGHPLHTYLRDSSKGSVINIGNHQFKGKWYALNANGGVVK